MQEKFRKGGCRTCGIHGCSQMGLNSEKYPGRGKLYLNTQSQLSGPFCGNTCHVIYHQISLLLQKLILNLKCILFSFMCIFHNRLPVCGHHGGRHKRDCGSVILNCLWRDRNNLSNGNYRVCLFIFLKSFFHI